MRLWGHLVLCAYLCLGDLSAVKDESLAHNVKRREPKRSLIGTRFTVSGGWDLSVGDTVVMNCSVTRDKQKKAYTAKLQLIWTKPGDNSTSILKTEMASKGISYTLDPITYEHRGMYSCLGDGSNPDVYIVDWHEFVWVKDPSAAVSLDVLSLNRVKFFYEKTVTIGCRLPDDNTQWKIMRCDDVEGVIEECPGHIKKDNVVSCTISTEYPLEMPYWCQSAAGQISNILNASHAVREVRRSQEIVGTRFEPTPAWYLRTGDSTVLDCSVHTDNHNNSNNIDLQLIWTQLGSEENNMKVLLSQRASQGFSYSLVNVTHDHQGVYTCWDDGSQPKVSVHPWHHFIWVEDDSPQVTINVLSPNRTQFFHDEKVTVGCQLPNDESQWKIKWFDQYTGKINSCRKPELSSTRFLSCIKYMGSPWSNKLFWCESSTGLRSNLLNTTNTVVKIVLEAPWVPVTEGDDMTLRCWQQDRSTKIITPARAGFHVNYKFIDKSEEGTITIKGVTKADEGFYQCSTRAEGMGHKTWITVKARV